MMKQAARLLMCMIMAISTVSCQKELSNESGDEQSAVNGVLKMKIDGVQWVADKIAQASIENGSIVITGLSNDEKALHIELVDIGAANYSLNQQTVDYATVTDNQETSPVAYATNEGQDAADAGGEVIVTNIDQTNKTISGTFTFRVFRDSDSKQLIITEGIFENLKYGSTDQNPGGGNVTPSFTVKIDGSTFTPTILDARHVSPLIMITATQTSGTSAKAVTISFPDNVVAGADNELTDNGAYMASYISGSGAGASVFTPVSGSGKVAITEHNTTTKVIKGTFFFEGEDQIGGAANVQLTEGAFTVQYQ